MSKTAPSPKVYTRTGDQGTTSLFGGARVAKNHPRLEAYGTLDELNCVVGFLRAEIESTNWSSSQGLEADRVHEELLKIQALLFRLGSRLATESDAARAKLPALSDQDIAAMESWMDRMSVDLAELHNFILPGGTKPAAAAHIARTVARRAERDIVALLDDPTAVGATADDLKLIVRTVNRLNDYFFVLARHLNRLAGKSEPIWKP